MTLILSDVNECLNTLIKDGSLYILHNMALFIFITLNRISVVSVSSLKKTQNMRLSIVFKLFTEHNKIQKKKQLHDK